MEKNKPNSYYITLKFLISEVSGAEHMPLLPCFGLFCWVKQWKLEGEKKERRTRLTRNNKPIH